MDRFLVFYTYKGEVKNIIILANNKTDALKAMDYYDIIEIFYHDDMGKEDVKELEDFYKDKMTNKINMVINLSILGLLIYMAIAIKKIEHKVFPDSNLMIPLNQLSYENTDKDQIGFMIKQLLISKIKEANDGWNW